MDPFIVIASSFLIGIPISIIFGVISTICSILSYKELRSISQFLNNPPPLEFRSMSDHSHSCEDKKEHKVGGSYL